MKGSIYYGIYPVLVRIWWWKKELKNKYSWNRPLQSQSKASDHPGHRVTTEVPKALEETLEEDTSSEAAEEEEEEKVIRVNVDQMQIQEHAVTPSCRGNVPVAAKPSS